MGNQRRQKCVWLRADSFITLPVASRTPAVPLARHYRADPGHRHPAGFASAAKAAILAVGTVARISIVVAAVEDGGERPWLRPKSTACGRGRQRHTRSRLISAPTPETLADVGEIADESVGNIHGAAAA